jgi:tRNA(fMet)-specific endonuclease VapC
MADFLKRREPATRLIDALAEDGVAISIISYAELYEGVAHLADDDIRRAELERLTETVDVIGIDAGTARVFGDPRSEVRASGQLIADMDLLIASTALRYELTLVNRDHHFDRIPDLKRHAEPKG